MTVIASSGRIERIHRPWPSHVQTSLSLYGELTQDYAAIWRTQPAVRQIAGFLGRNIAQLGIHVFRRLSDTNRERLSDHPLAATLAEPGWGRTRYELIDRLVQDRAVFDRAYLAKVRGTDDALRLLRLPPLITEPIGDVWVAPEAFLVKGSHGYMEIAADRVVHFHGYNPLDDREGVSPMETLRRVLSEEAAMGEHREHFWRNAARYEGVLERPKEAGQWSDPARKRFREEWQAFHASAKNAGKAPILEDGMQFKQVSWSARDAEYIATRKLNREEVASFFHIPPTMVGILEHATYSNVEEQHKHLYQDTLGPWLREIEQRLELDLLADFVDNDRVYLEFNLAEKLKGSFEDQARAGQTAVGRPFMTANEFRARNNLPPIDGGDGLVTPLNVLVGGQASPNDSAPPPKALGVKAAADPTNAPLRERHVDKHREVLAGFFARQQQVVLSRYGADAPAGALFDVDRWNRELSADVYVLCRATAAVFGRLAVDLIEGKARRKQFDPDDLDDFLLENARVTAEGINEATFERVAAATDDDDPRGALDELFVGLAAVTAGRYARTMVTRSANFGAQAGARSAGAKWKTWVTTSANPRPEHAALNGVTVPMNDAFPGVGMMWPGDPAGGAEHNSNCACSFSFR